MMFVLVAVLLSYLRPYGLPRHGQVQPPARGGPALRRPDGARCAATGRRPVLVGDRLDMRLSRHLGRAAWPLDRAVRLAVGRRTRRRHGRLLRRRPCIRRVVCCLLVGFGLVAIYELPLFGFSADRVAELVCAAGGSVVLALIVELAGRFEKYTAIPRHFLAIGFVLLAIAAHWIAMRVIPGLR